MRKTTQQQGRVLARMLAVELAEVHGGRNSVCATGKVDGGQDITDTNNGDGCKPSV
jgi:hypothetical protein